MSAPRQLLFLSIAFSTLLLSGCGGSMAELRSENTMLDRRVDELERSNRGLQVRLDAYEASVTLVEDQVRALELTQRQVGRTQKLDVVRLEPQNSWSEPVYVEPQQHYEEESYDDIVVTEEKMARYFGAQEPTVVPATTSSGPSRTKRKAQPPVVAGDKLPMPGAKVSASSDPIDLYKAGLKEYRQERFEPAIELFTQFLDRNPAADYVDNALYWLGECHYGLGNYADAAGYFHRIVEEFPDANKVPDALLKVGLTYQRLDKKDSAREVLYYLIEAYPKSEAARVARQRLDNLASS